jgi:hypothetical protein
MAISSHSSQTARLVGGGISVSPIPSISIKTNSIPLYDSGSSYDQTIDGSSTPVDFYYGPGSGEIQYVENVTFGIDDGGGCPPDAYGAIATGLTNGTQLILEKDSTEYVLANLQNNGDIALTFNYAVGFFENGKFLAMANGFFGKMVFATNIELDGDNSDKIIVRVRDNLTGLLFQRVNVQVFSRLT